MQNFENYLQEVIKGEAVRSPAPSLFVNMDIQHVFKCNYFAFIQDVERS